MSDENGTYPKVQLSTFVLGDQFVFRGETGEELSGTLAGVAEHADNIVTALNAVKQTNVANGVMTGDSQKGGKSAPATRAAGDDRKADAPPPSGDTPVCGCGVPMQDLSHKNYKNRFYAADGCKTKGKDKACWAKK